MCTVKQTCYLEFIGLLQKERADREVKIWNSERSELLLLSCSHICLMEPGCRHPLEFTAAELPICFWSGSDCKHSSQSENMLLSHRNPLTICSIYTTAGGWLKSTNATLLNFDKDIDGDRVPSGITNSQHLKSAIFSSFWNYVYHFWLKLLRCVRLMHNLHLEICRPNSV